MIAASAASMLESGRAHRARGHRDQQVMHGRSPRRVSDELVHDAQAAADRPPFPHSGPRSPRMIRNRVVLPAPFAPMSAEIAPSPTRNETSSSRDRPSAQRVRDSVDVDVSHENLQSRQAPKDARVERAFHIMSRAAPARVTAGSSALRPPSGCRAGATPRARPL